MKRRSKLIVLAALTACLANAQDIAGDWHGALKAGSQQLRVVLHFSKDNSGTLHATMDSIDQGSNGIPIDSVTLKEGSLEFRSDVLHGEYKGTVNADGQLITGTWSQGTPLPLELRRGPWPIEPAKPAPASKLPPQMVAVVGVPVDLNVPVPPAAFLGGDGRTHLVYELHITNFSPFELHLKQIEVSSADAKLAAFEGTDLNSLLTQPGSTDISSDRRTIGQGQRAIAFLWITLESNAPVPTVLRHRLTVDDYPVEISVAVVAARPRVLSPPLRGSGWLAANGPSNTSPHRRALMPMEGKAHDAQRFAIDWVKQGPDGKTFTGNSKDNKNYHAYGSEVLAVADGLVSAVKDGIPQNEPGVTSRAVPITAETIGGNDVILDLGGGRFAFYAHLQPGSLRVKVGDRVRRGQVLALAGNSGNSTEPHLHFHVSDANSPLASEGQPYVLNSFDVLDNGTEIHRQAALPMQNQKVRFPETPVE